MQTMPDNATTPRPVVFMFHGGCFTGGSKSEMDKEAAAFAEDGVVVVNVEYRRKAPYPASWQDAMAAVRYMRANAATYNMATNREAGKMLFAAMLAAQARGATVEVQMMSVSGGYLVMDRIWVVE